MISKSYAKYNNIWYKRLSEWNNQVLALFIQKAKAQFHCNIKIFCNKNILVIITYNSGTKVEIVIIFHI